MNDLLKTVAAGLSGLALFLVAGCAGDGDAVPDAPTFNRDVAPIVFGNCSPCHHPAGPAPFTLLTYADVRRRAREIVRVTGTRYMPPWLPAPGEHAFAGDRALSDAEIATLRRWQERGEAEGDPADLPSAPRAVEGWQLGQPDLVVTLERSYTLPASGFDVFRNFALPILLERSRYVAAVEMRPGNAKIVHHAILRLDETSRSRDLDRLDEEPGFAGMEMGGARAPQGQFLGWTPGKVPLPPSPERAWRLRPGTDLVLQLHMLPSGKPETIRPQVGFHFVDTAPPFYPASLTLYDNRIDIPAGVRDFTIEDSLTLPAAVELLGLYPHAHYLGKDLRVTALLPDGRETTLLHIPDWDFNWQDEYRFLEPVALPAGARVRMRYVYDNSSDNPRNPTVPPQRVRYGERSTDEMGTLTVQLLARDDDERSELHEAWARRALEKDADDWEAHLLLGTLLVGRADPGAALPHLQTALRLNPRFAEAHDGLGGALQALGRTGEAMTHFREALRLDPVLAGAWNNLGNALLVSGRAEEAIDPFQRALELQPDLADAHYNLGVACTELNRLDEAAAHYRRALQHAPDDAMTHSNLGVALQLQGRPGEAIAAYRQALEIDPGLAEAHNNMGRALLDRGEGQAAIEHFREALRLDPDFALARGNLDAALRSNRR